MFSSVPFYVVVMSNALSYCLSNMLSIRRIAAYVCFTVVLLHGAELRPQSTERDFLTNNQCGYESCPQIQPNLLNVHLIPHSHDDVGWLKTVDQYYYGSKTLIQKAGVQYILDSVIQELLRDPKKRFIYVESAFFFKWWSEQNEELQEQVTMLVNEGRLEFIGGAWSMNDEATTHYQSIIDQFAWGLRRLNDTFGKCSRPRIGWQIDPFGHSREMASMFAQMGFDGLFFGRLDYQDRDERLKTKTAEMIWRASANLGKSSDLFTGALYNQYQPPPGFCFDILCADEPIIDGKHSPDNNVERRINDFLTIVKKMAKAYRSRNILVTMGEDFNYQHAGMWYKNLDKLIKYANARQANGSDINLLYSTPSCYLKSLHDADITWPTKDDDFFPYASDPHAYWTGYFTSRPTLKRFERVGNHFLQICKQLTALPPAMYPEWLPHLGFMRETMGIMQHHDAVTGTEKQKVAYDYAKRLEVAFRACGANTRAALNLLTTGNNPEPVEGHTRRPVKFQFESCPLLNISLCDVSEESDQFVLTLYNPLSYSTAEYIRVPVSDNNFQILDHKGVILETQYVPIPANLIDLSYRDSQAKYEMVFLADELPPLGYRSYYIKKTNEPSLKPIPDPANTSSMTRIGNEHIRLNFDTNGFLAAVTVEGMTRIISQDFLYYEGAVGNNLEFQNRSSGAYIFRPLNSTIKIVTTKVDITVYRGSLVEEVHQVFNDWISQVVRVYRHKNYAEFEWLVGPIPIDDDVGKEVITRFETDIKSEGIFFTDSNGREMIKRLRNHRDTWNVDIVEPEAGNYYPITTKIALEDNRARLAILTDRAQGGSSLKDGSLELMVHRRLLHDDAFGVGEALNETAYGQGLIARGTHYLMAGFSQKIDSPTQEALERFAQLETTLPTWKFFSKTEYTFEDWMQNFTNSFIGLGESLPQNVHLLTLEPWHDGELLVRFEHILEKDEDPEFSKSVKFNIKEILRNFDIQDIRETTLDGNAWLDEHHRMEFVSDSEHVDFVNYATISEEHQNVRLLKAHKPLIRPEYHEESLLNFGLGSEHKLDPNPNTPFNTIRRKKLEQMKLDENDSIHPHEASDSKYDIELSAMQIRTFVIYLRENQVLISI
uniref:Alpha-mannosidase n=1 Tax=Glossina brevipalpis TaxID=37001 RepID=A0A1A9W6T1_9MUSC